LLGVTLSITFVLAACSNDGPENAKNYIEALAAGDQAEAEQYVCDDNKEALIAEATIENVFSVRDIECEDAGDDVVRCFFKISDGEDEFDLSTRFLMDGGKVCGVIDQ
jgi:hypothetical protein